MSVAAWYRGVRACASPPARVRVGGTAPALRVRAPNRLANRAMKASFLGKPRERVAVGGFRFQRRNRRRRCAAGGENNGARKSPGELAEALRRKVRPQSMEPGGSLRTEDE